MTSNKFLNQTINLQIMFKGYGHWQFIIDTLEGRYKHLTTNSLLIDSIKSNEDELTRYGTIQDAIDYAIQCTLLANNINL
jgi:hypothetical protein